MRPRGLTEDTVRFISAKKGEPEWMLEWRLGAYRRWREMTEPNWARVHYPKIDYQNAYYYAAPKNTPLKQSLDEVDPKLLETYKKLGIPLHEQKLLAGVAVDAVFDSVSVATTFKAKLNEAGVIFCPISEAIRDHPDLVKKYLGTRRAGERTISSPRSIRRCSPTAVSFMCRRACAARWSFPPISASMRAKRANSNARSSSPTKAPMSAISKAAPRPSATRTSFMPPWWN